MFSEKTAPSFCVRFQMTPHGNAQGGAGGRHRAWNDEGEDNRRRKKDTEGYHTPADPKGSADYMLIILLLYYYIGLLS